MNAVSPPPSFPETWCSQCGKGFGPGNHGFSHCEDHQFATIASKQRNNPMLDHLKDPRLFKILCRKCEGAGAYDQPHPMWGSRSCQEAYVSAICDECQGEGKIYYDRGELFEHLREVMDECDISTNHEEQAEAVLTYLENIHVLPKVSK
jgi:hypothetical protein